VELLDPMVRRQVLRHHAEPVAAARVEVSFRGTPRRAPRGECLDRPVEQRIVGASCDEERRRVVGNRPLLRGSVDRADECGSYVSVVVRRDLEDETRAGREPERAYSVRLDVPVPRSRAHEFEGGDAVGEWDRRELVHPANTDGQQPFPLRPWFRTRNCTVPERDRIDAHHTTTVLRAYEQRLHDAADMNACALVSMRVLRDCLVPNVHEDDGTTVMFTEEPDVPDTVFLPDRIEVTRPIPASPSAIFDILRSPAGHVAIDASGMLQDFTGEPAEKVGDTFVIHMDRESLNDFPLGRYDVTVHIITFDRDKEIAWNLGPDIPIAHFYGYRLEPGEDGLTNVISYYDWSQVSSDFKERFPIVPESALRATLGILECTVRAR
jgi:hypothetical protein